MTYGSHREMPIAVGGSLNFNNPRLLAGYAELGIRPAKLGLKNVASDKFPLVGIQSLTSFGGSNLADPQTTSLNFDFVDSLFLIHGRHSIRAGGEYRKLRERLWQPGASSGNISFNTLPTMNPLTRLNGVGFASFLLGIPGTSNLNLYPSQKDRFGFSWNYYAGYLQDDFRVSSKLTLNLGLRWEMTMGRTESQNRQSNFNLSTLEFQYAGQNGFPETLYAAPRRNFQPRIGLAYAPFGGTRTVIRAGYGIFFAAPNTYGDPYTTGPWSRSYNYVSLDNGITFPLTLREGFPPVSFNDPYVLSPLTGVGWLPRNYLDGYMQQWGLNIQREVFRQTLVEIGYVGTRGTHLKMGSYELNQVPANLLGPGDAQSRRPYPTRGSISAMYLPIGNSTYHALQARFERRFQRGLAFQGAYTFSKSIDDCSGFASNSSYGVTSVQDNYNLRAERSVSGFDRTQNFAWNFSWELPAGKDRRWLNRGGWLNAVAGGWNLAAIMSTLSGLPPLMGTVQNLTGALGGGSRPNRLRNGKLSGEERGRLRWFDATAFALPAPFTFGSTSRTEPQLREPGSFGLTMLLAKEFSFGEKRRLELRSEWGNALNHFNPGGPNTTIGHAAVGTIVSGNAGRSISLALRLHY